jgi:hypothetical protein
VLVQPVLYRLWAKPALESKKKREIAALNFTLSKHSPVE